ncbi:hypothetical protein, partial [Thiolapillus sp.]
DMSIDFSCVVKFQEKVCTGSGRENRCGFLGAYAQGTPGKQCGLAATGVYQPSLRSPWLAADATAPSTEIRGNTYSVIQYFCHAPAHVGR